MTTTALALAFTLVLGWMFWISLSEIRAADRRGGEAYYLVSRVGARLGCRVRERPLSLYLPQGRETVLHYHLLTVGYERDSITLRTERPDSSPLGDFVIDSSSRRMFGGGRLRWVPLGDPHFDRCFRIFAEPEHLDRVRNRLAIHHEILRLVRDLSCRSRRGHLEIADLGGQVKIQFDDRAIRFPSDVERISFDLVRLFELYRRMAGASETSSVQDGTPSCFATGSLGEGADRR